MFRGKSLLALSASLLVVDAGAFENPFTNGKFQGTIRLYNNYRDYEVATPVRAGSSRALALGGSLRYETGKVAGFSGAVKFATTNNMGLGAKDPRKRSFLVPAENIDVLSESYLRYENWGFDLKVGSQELYTPLANPSDAFMIPNTFNAQNLVYKLNDNIQFIFSNINKIKARTAGEFENVGSWITNRYGVARKSTNGTLVGGVKLNYKPVQFEAWYYNFDEVMNTVYAQSSVGHSFGDHFTELSVQYGSQKEVGDKLLGDIDSTMVGAQALYKFKKFRVLVGFNHVKETDNVRGKGTWLEPYSFFTSPLYTNSMVMGVGNSLPGTASKITAFYDVTSDFTVKLSYTDFNFKNIGNLASGVAKDEVDFDFMWNLKKYLPGLTFTNRIAKLSTDEKNQELLEIRSQLQYAF